MSRTVLFLSKGLHAASTRYRATAFFDELQRAGWSPQHLDTHGGPVGRLKLLVAAGRADAVVVLRRTFNLPMCRLLRRAARHLIFDLDDAIYLGDDGHPAPTRQRRFASMVQMCDQVWAGNTQLAEYVSGLQPRVQVLPTVVDPRSYNVGARRPTDHVDLVWIGSHTTRKYLEYAVPMLEIASRRRHDLRLKVVADFDLPSSNLPVFAVSWQSETESRELASAHIGIAPLPDDPWAHGKCGLKVIQYMAAQLPVVSSPVGANAQIVVDGETGFLAHTEADWLKAIDRLASDSALAARMGRAGRRRVEQHYCRERTAARMVELLDAAAT